jgi:gamma-glutamylcyclotransferase (GGCT)/AIG2-like uncharacterized protein YtfP
MTRLRMFVYGTLKRGGVNHDAYCSRARDISQAALWGRLYALKAGYPGLELPLEAILANASKDPLSDTRKQFDFPSPAVVRPTGMWDLVRGELMTFDYPERELPALDELEDFRPGDDGLYTRALVGVQCDDGPVAAWAYYLSELPAGSIRLTAGRWR